MNRPEMNRHLSSSPEGKILLAGLVMVMLYVGAIILSGIMAPEVYKMLTAVAASHILIGRVPGITLAFAMDAPLWAAAGLNFYIETVTVLFLYPLFILSWNKLIANKTLDTWLERARTNAETYRPLIEKYGRIGLFVFVWIPFWMTGPFVGSIIGFLMGFRHRLTLSIVLFGTALATLCWALLLQGMHEWVLSIDPRAPWIIIGLMVILVLLAYGIRRLFKS
jgi:uncharacterized membrane protein